MVELIVRMLPMSLLIAVSSDIYVYIIHFYIIIPIRIIVFTMTVCSFNICVLSLYFVAMAIFIIYKLAKFGFQTI